MSPSKNGFQPNLFSFFSVKPPSAKNKAASPPRLTQESIRSQPSSSGATITLPPRYEKDASTLKVGMKVKVYWPMDDEMYEAKIIHRKDNTTVFTLLYTDGDQETVDMKTEVYEILDATTTEADGASGDKDAGTENLGAEDTGDEGEEVESEDDDDGSVFKEPVDESSDEEEEFNWDDAEEEKEPPKKRTRLSPITDRKSEVKLEAKSETKHVTETTLLATETNKVTPMSGLSSLRAEPEISCSQMSSSSIKPKSLFLTPSANKSVPKTNEGQNERIVTPPPTKSIPNFRDVDGELYRGSHLHHYLNFIQNPCDIKRRPASHPDYDGKTLYVDFREIEKVQGKPLTALQQQWWEIKQYYNDCVLFFKMGKFYEVFHMDADISTKVLNHNYMKGAYAHSGAPEIAYGEMVDKLVKAGYKVARVEQTETPADLDLRAKKLSGKKKPKIVTREVCGVVSIGTRKFDFMDSSYTETGPLLIIREVMLPCDELDGDDKFVKATCEYGITIVDAVRSVVTMGQFADDALRSRMYTLLTNYSPSEILLPPQVSSDLRMLIKSSCPTARLETINNSVIYPNSTALDPRVRKSLERQSPAHPWDVKETNYELHRCSYFPKASKKIENYDIHRWPVVLQACIDGNADLAISSLGAALYTLQRNLVAHEILSMGNFQAYIPPSSATLEKHVDTPQPVATCPKVSLSACYHERTSVEDGTILLTDSLGTDADTLREESAMDMEVDGSSSCSLEALHKFEQSITHLQMDGTTLTNLEILSNQHDSSSRGTLWEKVNHTKTPHGARLLRAWMLRPLFQKAAIDRRCEAVTECLSGEVALAIEEARSHLSKCGDLERYAARIFSMKLEEDDHPSSRAISHEAATNTKKKVEFFSKMLSGMQSIVRVRECFDRVQSFQSGLLEKVVLNLVHDQMELELNWFITNFDCKNAAAGNYEPPRGLDPEYDAACEEIESIKQQLDEYKDEMCRNNLPSKARSYWKYVNTTAPRDKYLIELPGSIEVPSFFIVKGKRGKGANQVIKYRTPTVADLVVKLENAITIQEKGREKGMNMIFAKFDEKRPMWEAATQASALLDALQSLAKISCSPGFVKPLVLDCDNGPKFDVRKGWHPLVNLTHNGGEFIPNDLTLGGNDEARVLLLSGPNMGGKSTLLRQTCLIILLAQIGCYVPAESFSFTPVDRIFTRLGATDRILDGQSTFFVELLETSAALRGATRRSLVIMDELGRGTSTFDGTAIADASLHNLVDSNNSLVLFATHYHSLLEDWRNSNTVRLGHMECMQTEGADDITFLYTLGNGACPRSFGINVAKLAGLPQEVLETAKHKSSTFEQELFQKQQGNNDVEDYELSSFLNLLQNAVDSGDINEIEQHWHSAVNTM